MITVMSAHASAEFLKANNATNPTFTTKEGVPASLRCPYLHAMAEDLAGCDLVAYTEDTVIEDLPEQPCTLVLEGGTEYECILVMWNPKADYPLDIWRHEGPVPTGAIVWTDIKSKPWKWSLSYKGLICLKDDTEALECARKKARKRASFL